MVSSISVESLGSAFRKLFGYMECISIGRELVAHMVSPLHFCCWYSAVYWLGYVWPGHSVCLH